MRQLARRHPEELAANGMAVQRGADLRQFESDNVSLSLGSYPQARQSLKARHRKELTANGMVTLQGSDLAAFKRDILSRYPGSYPQPRSSLTLFPRRAVLNIAMLLRDSEVARQVRAYLLDVEQASRATLDGPALDDRIDQRIAHVLGKTVVPMFNALIETSGEHQRELVAMRDGVGRIEQRLRTHHARLRRLEGRKP
ncbi:restriction endonuclease [Streptomyces bauhiniae]